MNLDTPTADIVTEAAMSEEECARAIAYGMMAVEPGIDALAVGEMGIGNTTVAAALCLGAVRRRGGRLDRPRHRGRRRRARTRSARPSPLPSRGIGRRPGDPFDVLRRLGGLEFAAMAGAILAARMGRVPVVLDGFSAAPPPRCCTPPIRARSTIASPATSRPSPGTAGCSNGSASARCSISACGLAKPRARRWRWLLKAAAACHAGMATFAEAGVSGPA